LNRKFFFLGIVLILVIAIPLVAAAVTQTQTIHVTGNAKYPHNTPQPATNPTPTPTPSTAMPTVQFQLFFPNGTAYPTAVTGAITGVNTVVVDPMTGHNGGWMPTCIVVRNTGITPIAINAAIANKNVPSNIDLTLTCGYYGTISGGYGADQATTQQPIQPGQTYYMSLIAFLTPTGSYTPDQQFSYSFDVVVTATQS
jgi:hypothetical protein